MINLDQIDSSNLDAVASQWIARRDHGMTAAEETELARWLSDPRHAEAFSRCETVWGALARVPVKELDALMVPRRRRRLAPVVWLSIAAAAGVAAVFFVLRSPVSEPRPESFVVAYSAPADAEARVALPDGSVAILRRGSRIALGNSASGRHVRLVSGEAIFTVAKTSTEPFLVNVRAVTVRDIGTAFDVQLNHDRIAVLVTEGRVEVNGDSAASAAKGDSPIRLSVGQQSVISADMAVSAVNVRLLTKSEMEQVFAWKSRRLSFDRTPLSEAVAELNRYNVRQVLLADASIGSEPISGSVQADNLDVFIGLLHSGFGFEGDFRGNVVILHKSK